MNEIVKVCKKHGALTKDQIRIEILKKKGNKELIRCFLCRKEGKEKYFKTNHEKRMAYIKKWKEENRDRINERSTELRKLYPEKESLRREREKVARYRSPEKVKRRNAQAIAKKRGINVEHYYELYKLQDGKCAICKKEETRELRGKIMPLALDHCHKTDKNRKFLCHMCNVGIGSLRDDINLMAAAIEYIKEHS